MKWAFLSGEYNKQTKKRAGPLNPQFPTTRKTTQKGVVDLPYTPVVSIATG